MITGGGGVGKSHFIRFLSRYHPSVAITASTGIAGVNIAGKTLDSFMGFSRTTQTIEQAGSIRERHIRDRLSQTETLLIDESGTLRIDKFEMTEARLRAAKKDKRPFGGVQIILVADFMQLTPVIQKQSPEGQEFLRLYQGRVFVFESDIYKQGNFHPYLLHQYVRNGNETERRILRNMRMGNELDKVVTLINHYANGSTLQDDAIIICKTNAQADKLNKEALALNPNPEAVYCAKISPEYPDHLRPIDEEITLKKGCRVLLILNNPDFGYMNGDVGEVVELRSDSIRVKLDRGEIVNVERYEWEYLETTIVAGQSKDVPVGTYSQLPIRLGRAITAHKCQGLTLQSAYVDLSGGFNADGMAYVIVSRVVSLSGLKLSRPLRKSDIWVNKKAVQFTLEISRASLALEQERILSMHLHLKSFGVNIDASKPF